MRHEPTTPHRGTALVACLGTLAALTAGCSSSGADNITARTPSQPTARTTSTAPKSSPSSADASSTPPAGPSTADPRVNLSGSWSGRYSGAYSGTFNLSWQQRGSHLSGRITLSSPSSTLRLNGNVKGTAITFGTVGSSAITYSGTVAGKAMSGAFQVGGQSGGTWSATKS